MKIAKNIAIIFLIIIIFLYFLLTLLLLTAYTTGNPVINEKGLAIFVSGIIPIGTICLSILGFSFADKLNLNKTVYERRQYDNVIDNSFTQLVPPPPVTSSITPEDQVATFFNDYQKLFFDIPKTGETNSHEYLIKQSSEYINFQFIDNTAQALLDEITALREENLVLQQQIIGSITNGG